MDKPVSRLDYGSVLCKRCWQRLEHRCVHCGNTKPAALIDDEGPCCYLCYNRFRRARRTCGRCGRERTISRNAVGDQPDLCDSCYRGPEVICSICGRLRPCHGISMGRPICGTCYRRPTHTCCRCGKQRGSTAHWPMGPVCDPCYAAVLRAPAQCAGCRITQPLIGLDDDGNGVCGPCAGFGVDYTCHPCGRAGNPYGREGCAHCVLTDRVRRPESCPNATRISTGSRHGLTTTWSTIPPSTPTSSDRFCTGICSDAKYEAGDVAEALRLSQRVIDLAGGDSAQGNRVYLAALARATMMRGLARCSLGQPGWKTDLDEAISMAGVLDPTSRVLVVTYAYGITVANGALLSMRQ